MKILILLGIGIICFALGACAGTPIGMDVVYRSSQCTSKQAGLVSLKSQSVFEHAVSSRARITSANDTPAPADLDFGNKHIVLISMGEKSTAGYRLQIDDVAPKLDRNTLFLPVHFKGPDGDMQAHVITSPCLIISLDKGDYKMVRAQGYSLQL